MGLRLVNPRHVLLQTIWDKLKDEVLSDLAIVIDGVKDVKQCHTSRTIFDLLQYLIFTAHFSLGLPHSFHCNSSFSIHVKSFKDIAYVSDSLELPNVPDPSMLTGTSIGGVSLFILSLIINTYNF